jgi:hypothetical protein
MGEAYSALLARKVLGPFDVLDHVAAEPVSVCTLPFREIEGGAVSVVLNENVSGSGAGGTFSEAMVEIEIVGIVQGQVDVLKRAWLTGLSGPVRKTFEAFEVYDTLEIRARNMMGGRSGGNNDPTNVNGPVLLTTGLGFFCRLTVNLQPKRNEIRIAKPRLAHE